MCWFRQNISPMCCFSSYLISIYIFHFIIYVCIFYAFETTYWHRYHTDSFPSSYIHTIIPYFKSKRLIIFWSRCPKMSCRSCTIYTSSSQYTSCIWYIKCFYKTFYILSTQIICRISFSSYISWIFLSLRCNILYSIVS